MTILPSTDVNFQALAENIVNNFYSDGTPLADGIVKISKENSFTPEEVIRLLEKTNTAASIHLLKTADDKKATFTLAQPDLVLQQTHPMVSDDVEEEKTASVKQEYFGIPKTRGVLPKIPSFEKTASESKPSIDAVRSVYVVKQALDSKKLEKVALEQKIQDKIDYLVSEFNVWKGPNFEKFASDSYNIYGIKSVPVLMGISKYLGVNLKKIACDCEDFIDNTTSHMKAMKSICNGLDTIVKLGSEISELNQILYKLESGLKQYARGSKC